MLKLLIIRHANPIYETDSITEEGKKQAGKLAERIKRLEKIDAIYVSPYGRTIQTASYIAEATGLKPKVLEWLREIDKGEYPWGKPHNEYLKTGKFGDPVSWENGYWAGKELREAYNEVSSGLDELLKEYGYMRDSFVYKIEGPAEEKVVCLVCHGGVTMVILSHLLQWHLPLSYAHVSILESSVARILFRQQGENDAVPTLLSLSDESHLDDVLWKDLMNRQTDKKVAM